LQRDEDFAHQNERISVEFSRIAENLVAQNSEFVSRMEIMVRFNPLFIPHFFVIVSVLMIVFRFVLILFLSNLFCHCFSFNDCV